MVGASVSYRAGDEELGEWWIRQRLRLDVDARPPFDSVLLLVAWCVWKEEQRNISEVVGKPAVYVSGYMLREAEDWISAGISTLAAVFSFWSQNSATM